jgi:hypothetical protein
MTPTENTTAGPVAAGGEHPAAHWPLPSFDAQDWAKEFMRIFGTDRRGDIDEELMVGWFANALMRGYDEHAWRNPAPADLCKGCGQPEELRLGFCFDCAAAGEARAAKRSVVQHLGRGVRNLLKRNPNWRYDFAWARERLTKTGDYAPGDYFEREGIAA